MHSSFDNIPLIVTTSAEDFILLNINHDNIAAIIIYGDIEKHAKIIEQRFASFPNIVKILNSTPELALKCGANGVHINNIHDLKNFRNKKMYPDLIFGTEIITSKHDAITAGEMNIDYIFFGKLEHIPTINQFAKNIELCNWWSENTRIPAVLQMNNDNEKLLKNVTTYPDFIAIDNSLLLMNRQ